MGETDLDEVGMEQGIWGVLRHSDFRRFSGTVQKWTCDGNLATYATVIIQIS
jgi:hypothetical protein